mmetsp:Transcript_49446/g.98198  ORF Transcript_49446/g.98198 Transcript_49446/m.98198 type:complete len:143 (+) Transcript_49446:25-453(+)
MWVRNIRYFRGYFLYCKLLWVVPMPYDFETTVYTCVPFFYQAPEEMLTDFAGQTWQHRLPKNNLTNGTDSSLQPDFKEYLSIVRRGYVTNDSSPESCEVLPRYRFLPCDHVDVDRYKGMATCLACCMLLRPLVCAFTRRRRL